MVDEKRNQSTFDLAGMMENAFLMGVGVFEASREKMTEVADDLIERGKLSQSEAKKVADRLSEIAEEQQERIRNTVVKETDEALKGAGVATKRDLDDLRAQIAELKTLLLESTGAAPAPQASPAGPTASAGAASEGGAPSDTSAATIADLPSD